MEILEDNDFQLLIWDKDFKMMHVIWKKESENMTEDEYKTQTMNLIEWSAQNKAQKLLVDGSKANVVITVEQTTWTNEQYASLGKNLRKSAIIRPKDAVADVSVELAVEEKPLSFEVQFFENETKAREWLVQ